MGIPQTAKRLTARDYYVMERAADFKSEFFEGEIFAMAGGSTRHSFIKTQLSSELRTKLRANGGCRPCDSDQRIKILATGLRTYPDVSVFCGPLEYDTEDDQKETATNPTALFEVLSDSTEAYDRGTKAEHYRKIPGLKAYALLSQNAPHVELFERQADGAWSMMEASGMTAVLRMNSLGIDLSLGEIYERIEFPETVLKVVPLKH